jgi:hypothetical protein
MIPPLRRFGGGVYRVPTDNVWRRGKTARYSDRGDEPGSRDELAT